MRGIGDTISSIGGSPDVFRTLRASLQSAQHKSRGEYACDAHAGKDNHRKMPEDVHRSGLCNTLITALLFAQLWR